MSGGIGGFVPQSQPSGSQLGGGQLGGGRTPRSLEQVLSESGFQTPERPTGPEQQISVMFKDPLTGKMTSGGPHAKSHARAMSDFYTQNPEALEIAKQFEADRVAKANQTPSNRFSALASRVRQGPPSSMRDLQQSFDREINSPQYQALVQRYGQSMGQDQGALGQLQAIQARMQQQQDAMLDMPRAITGREQLMRGRSPVYQGPTLQNPPRNPYAQ